MKTIERICGNCGKVFMARLYKVEEGNGKYCSIHCSSQANYKIRPVSYKSNQKLDKNHNWKGGISFNRYKYSKQYKENNPEKNNAHQKVHIAIKNGTIIKQPCKICGCINSQAHHNDYSKPLEVVWLCAKHHREVHKSPVGRAVK